MVPNLLVFAALSLGSSATKQTGGLQKVVLERRPCYGTCPAYTLTLYADGTAEYSGGRYAPRQGAYIGKFFGGLERLGPLLDRWGYWKLKPAYDSPVTDVASQSVTVVAGSGSKTVVEQGRSGPPELYALQTLIDGLATNVRWTKQTSTTGGEPVPPVNIGDGSPIAFTRWSGLRKGTGSLVRNGQTTKLSTVRIELRSGGAMTIVPEENRGKAINGTWMRKDGKTVGLTVGGVASGTLRFMDRANPYLLTLKGKGFALDFRVTE